MTVKDSSGTTREALTVEVTILVDPTGVSGVVTTNWGSYVVPVGSVIALFDTTEAITVAVVAPL
jgi:archaellum component FlaG (FlaF/FlaG flagellin family)